MVSEKEIVEVFHVSAPAILDALKAGNYELASGLAQDCADGLGTLIEMDIDEVDDLSLGGATVSRDQDKMRQMKKLAAEISKEGERKCRR